MHLEALQGSFLSETNVYLAYIHFGGHFEFCVKMTPKRNFNIKNGFITLQLVELGPCLIRPKLKPVSKSVAFV